MTAAQLLDRHAIARRLGLSIKSVDKIRERTKKGTARVPFPQPVQKYARTPLWRTSDIDAYARATERIIHREPAPAEEMAS